MVIKSRLSSDISSKHLRYCNDGFVTVCDEIRLSSLQHACVVLV